MIQTTKKSSNQEYDSLQGKIGIQDELSNLVIPSVPGEYYAYSATFTRERPLYALMKCKANKDHPTTAVAYLGHEANLLFLLGNPNLAQVCSTSMARFLGWLENPVDETRFGETWIASAAISAGDFYKLHSQKDATKLVEICRAKCSEQRGVSDALRPGAVVAIMTDCGKYGMFFVKKLIPSLIQIDACHILL